MDVNEVAAYLRLPTERIEQIIQNGLPLPKSGKMQKLVAKSVNGKLVIEDSDLDAFQDAFSSEEPGRHPPTRVMRKLRVEARHKCAISNDIAPLHFHHILEWNKVQHYEPSLMMAICGVCHDRIGRGEIDYKEQLMYKDQLLLRTTDIPSLDAQFQSLMATAQAKPILGKLLPVISQAITDQGITEDVAHDFSYVSLETKNILNRVSREFFDALLEDDEVHVTQLDTLFKLPTSTQIKKEYLSLVADIRQRMSVYADSGLSFEFCLLKLRDALGDQPGLNEIDLRMIRALTTFMYANCDIGKKNAKA